MGLPHSTGAVAGIVFLVNLPFGFWRSKTRRFSRDWFLAVHIPVLLAMGIRILFGLGFVLVLLPLFVGAFFLGQLSGGYLGRIRIPPHLHPRSRRR